MLYGQRGQEQARMVGFVVEGTCTVTDPWLSFIGPANSYVGLLAGL